MSKGVARRRLTELIIIHIIHAVQLILVVKSTSHIEIVMIIVLVLVLVVLVVISTLTSILIKFVVVLVIVLVLCLMPAATMRHWRRSKHIRLARGCLAVGAPARRRENEGRIDLRRPNGRMHRQSIGGKTMRQNIFTIFMQEKMKRAADTRPEKNHCARRKNANSVSSIRYVLSDY